MFFLKLKEVVFPFFGNGIENFTAPLRWNILDKRVFVETTLFFKMEKRRIAFRDQIVCNGLNLLVGIRKTLHEILNETKSFAYFIQQISGSIQAAAGCGNRYRLRLWRLHTFGLSFAFFAPPSVGMISPVTRSRLPMSLRFARGCCFSLSQWNTDLYIYDPTAFIKLVYDCHCATS